MEPPKSPFYLDIEISECSDAEDLQMLLTSRVAPAAAGPAKPTRARVNRGKKNEIYIKGNHTIRSKFKVLDMAAIYDELNKIMAEYKRNARFYEGKGTPLSVLQAIDFLNTEVVQGKAEIDQKRKKALSKEINQIKKTVAAAYGEFEEEINQLKSQIDFQKLEEMTDEVEETAEVQTITTAPDQSVLARPADEAAKKRQVDDEEVDFSKRLTLSKEDRRKFWLLTKKSDRQEETQGKPTRAANRQRPAGRQRPKPSAAAGAAQAGSDAQLDGFSLTPESLKAYIREVYTHRSGADRESLEKDVKQLSYALENLSDDQMKGELVLLSLQQQMELVRDAPMPEPDSLDQCLALLKTFLDLVKSKASPITNYNRDDNHVFSEVELLKQLNSLVNQLTEEIEVSIKLSDPFDKHVAARLVQEIELIDFLFDYEEYVAGIADEAAGTIHLHVCARIIQLIHHISDDFVFNCRPLSEIFDEESISQTVTKYAQIVYAKSTLDKLTARVRLCHAFNMAINLQDLDGAVKHLTEAQKLGVQVSSDKYLVALFNRAIAQFGVASFKKQNLEGCKYYLFELLNSGNAEGLLSQYSITREKVLDLPDPLSNFPYHMHINLEEAKAAFLISSVLTESAKTVLFQDNLSGCQANKVFVSFLESHHSSLFVNSPRNIFDQIFSFYRKIVQTDPQASLAQIADVKYFSQLETFAGFVSQQVRKECLSCYIERIKSEPRTALSVQDLSSLFGIGQTELVKALGDRIATGDLQAKLDDARAIVHFNNGLRSILKGEKEYEILESLRSFAQLNEKIQSAKGQTEGKKGSKAYDVFSFIGKKFDAQEKTFHFNYDFAFFKRQIV